MDNPAPSYNGVPRAIIPRDPLLGVVPARVCEDCGGPVGWSGDAFLCHTCSGSNYRMRDLDSFRKRELKEPDWNSSFRSQVAKILWQNGKHSKAIRFLNCNCLGRPGVCITYPLEHKFFIPHNCEVVFCKECADEARRALLIDYWHVVCNAVLDFAGERDRHEELCALRAESEGALRKRIETQIGELWERVGKFIRQRGWVLARITFTLRADGQGLTPDLFKLMNSCIGGTMRGSIGSRKGFGFIYVDEVGFEKRGHLPDASRVAHGLNPHAHGLYFGPRIDWQKTRDIWMEITGKKFATASMGFFITKVKGFEKNPGRAIRWALNHMFKYVSKPPAVTPERLAALILAFDGAKRVHSLGLFYGKKPKRQRKECPCPKCSSLGIGSFITFEAESAGTVACIPRLEPIADLVSRGYESLRSAARSMVLTMGESREESWGASP
jgi:hypothetical protein